MESETGPKMRANNTTTSTALADTSTMAGAVKKRWKGEIQKPLVAVFVQIDYSPLIMNNSTHDRDGFSGRDLDPLLQPCA